MKRERRKKKSFGYRLYSVIASVFFVANILLATFLLFYVQEIQVTGNQYVSENSVLNSIYEDPKTCNSIYTFFKLKLGAYEKPVCVEDLDVRMLAPWKLRVVVKEKQMVGCTVTDGEYVYFSDEGLILLKSTELLEGVSVIDGIQTDGIELYGQIPINDNKVFSYIIQLTEALRNQELVADRIAWEDDSMNAYFGKVCVKLGKSAYEEKVMQYAAIKKELKGKEGILHLEHYTDSSNRISFETKKVENQ